MKIYGFYYNSEIEKAKEYLKKIDKKQLAILLLLIAINCAAPISIGSQPSQAGLGEVLYPTNTFLNFPGVSTGF